MIEKLKKRLPAAFFERENGSMPVRDWLLALTPEERKTIGDDIRAAEYGWPVGMPLCRSIAGRKGLWEIRTSVRDGIARVFFCVHEGHMVLLHGFTKKSQATPGIEIEIAIKRMKGLLEHER